MKMIVMLIQEYLQIQKGLKRVHLLDESSGSEDEHNLGDGKSSAEGSMGSNHSDIPKKKRKATVKSKEDSIPLPDPSHFPSTIAPR